MKTQESVDVDVNSLRTNGLHAVPDTTFFWASVSGAIISLIFGLFPIGMVIMQFRKDRLDFADDDRVDNHGAEMRRS